MSIKCKKCEDIVEDLSNTGEYITCKCGAVALDITEFYCRIIGESNNYEVLPHNIIN